MNKYAVIDAAAVPAASREAAALAVRFAAGELAIDVPRIRWFTPTEVVTETIRFDGGACLVGMCTGPDEVWLRADDSQYGSALEALSMGPADAAFHEVCHCWQFAQLGPPQDEIDRQRREEEARAYQRLNMGVSASFTRFAAERAADE